MRFILPANALNDFHRLRAEYQEIKEVDITAKPAKLGRPIFFGGTDIETRRKQIEFLEKISLVIRPFLISDLHHSESKPTIEQWDLHFAAVKVMLGACLYVQAQLSGSKENSVLYTLIQKHLGVTKHNYFDDGDKEACFWAVKDFLKADHMSASNRVQAAAQVTPLSPQEWDQFSSFIDAQCTQKSAASATNYPITCASRTVFGAVFGYAGATIGLLGAEVISRSAHAAPFQNRLTALIGSGLVVVGPQVGAALFAPVIAGKLITTYCNISMAHIMGISTNIIGQGVGIAVGLPLDVACKLLWNACAIIGARYYKGEQAMPSLNGIRIEDGAMVIDGIPMKLIAEDELKHLGKTIIEVREDNLYINDKPVVFTAAEMDQQGILYQQLRSKPLAQKDAVSP